MGENGRRKGRGEQPRVGENGRRKGRGEQPRVGENGRRKAFHVKMTIVSIHQWKIKKKNKYAL